MTPPKISVIIPFHDRFDWTLGAIQSVLAQTFRDFEIILIDDGSDEISNIKWTEIDLRIQYLRLETSRGPSQARNAGIAQATGDLIAFLDSDDVFLPDKLEIQFNVMKAFPSVMMSYTAAIMMDRNGKDIALFPVKQNNNIYPNIWENCSVLTPCVMIRKELLERFQFTERVRLGEDLILWAQISRLYPLHLIEKPLSKVRFLNSSTSIQPEKFISHISHVIRDGVMKDRHIGFITRQRILSNLNILIASQYLRLRKPALILKYIAIAFFYYPINTRFLRLLVKYSFLNKIFSLEHPPSISHLVGQAESGK